MRVLSRMLTDGTRCIRQSSVRSCSYEAVFHSACARFRHLFDSVHPVPRPEGFRRCRFGCSFSYPAEWSAESRKKPTPVIKVTSFLAENKIAPVGTPPKARGIIRAAKGKGNAGFHKKSPSGTGCPFRRGKTINFRENLYLLRSTANVARAISSSSLVGITMTGILLSSVLI